MVEISEAKLEDQEDLVEVLVPVFSDKALALLGDAEKAAILLPHILKAVEGITLLARENEKAVGAILVSVEPIKLPSEISTIMKKELGYFKALRAFRLMRDYERSLPKRKEKEALLEAVGVVEGFRGKGIGTELINRAEDWLVMQNIKHFGLSVKTSNPAVRLYSRLGFEKVSTFQNKLGHWIYMQKTLGSRS
ncbi:MAG: GNAT family N-acetyltransferase [Methanomassiliicoccales archaeon]|nr:MAG: GNAT family N-acetyltransferase [Methanomassiliicoccales archaeon]